MAQKNTASITFKAEVGEFNQQITSANNTMKDLRADMNLVEAQFKNTGDAADYYSNKSKLLEAQLEANQSKQEALNGKIEAAKRIFGESSTEVEKLARQLTYAQSEEQNLEAKLASTNSALEQQKRDAADAESAYGRLTAEIQDQESKVSRLREEIKRAAVAYGEDSNEVRDLQGQLSKANSDLQESKSKMEAAERAARDLSDGFDRVEDSARDAGSSIGDIAAGNVLADFAQDAIGQLTELESSTRDYRNEQAKLSTIAQNQGRDLEALKNQYTELYGITGDTTMSSTAIANLSAMGMSVEDMDKMVNIATGTWAQFGDSIPIDGLSESINESTKLGTTLTGPVVDAINWANKSQQEWAATLEGHSAAQDAFNAAIEEGATTEDAMNAALAACSDEQERQSMLVESLNSVYSPLADTYRETNDAVIAANTADVNLMDAQSKLAEQIAPLQTAFTNLVSEGISWLSENIDWLVPTVTGLATAFGVLYAAMNFEAILASLTAGITALSGAFTFIAAHPVVAIVAALAGLVTAFITLWNTNEDFRNFWTGLWDDLCNTVSGIATWFDENVIQPLTTAFQGLFDFLGGLFTDPFGTLQQAGQNIINWFNDNFPGLGTAIETVANFIGGLFTDPFGTLLSAGQNILNWFNETFPGVGSAIETVANFIGGLFTDPFGTLRTAGEGIITWFNDNFPGVSSAVETVMNTIGGFFEDPFGTLQTAAQNVVNWFNDNFPGVSSAVETVMNTIGGFFEDPFGSLQTAGDNIVKWFGDNFPNLENTAQGVIDYWGQLFTDPFGALHTAGDTIITFFADNFPGLEGIAEDVTTFWDDLFQDPFGTLQDAGLNIINWFDEKFPGLKTTAQEVTQFWDNLFKDPFGTLEDAARNILNWFDQKFPGLKTTMQGIMNFWEDLFKDPFGTLKNAAQNIINWFSNTFKLPEIKFPQIKLPHFKITGEFDLLSWPPKIPTISVDWYARGGILTQPTLFGFSGNSLLGGGEAGPEAVLPLRLLSEYLDSAVERAMECTEYSTDRLISAIERMSERVTVLELDGQLLARGTAGYSDRVSGTRQTLATRGVAI